MPDDKPQGQPEKSHGAPGVIAPTNRINVALPFARIETHEPSAEMAELAAVTAGLAAIVTELAPGEDATRLTERAQALVGSVGLRRRGP